MEYIFNSITLPASIVITCETENDANRILELIVQETTENDYRLVDELNEAQNEN